MLDHFRDLEERLLRQDVRHSPNEAGALLAADFFEFGRSGIVWSRQQTVDSLAREQPIERSMTDFSARLMGDDVVLVTYRSSAATDGGEHGIDPRFQGAGAAPGNERPGL